MLYWFGPLYRYFPPELNIYLGASVFNGPHKAEEIPKGHSMKYVVMWCVIIFIKQMVSYFAAIKPMWELQHVAKKYINADDPSLAIEDMSMNFGFFTANMSNGDGLLMLVPLWGMILIFYVSDLEIWYQMVSAVTSALIGDNEIICMFL